MQHPISQILKQITLSEAVIIDAQEAKTALVDTLMKEVTMNCNLFADLWQKSEADIQSRMTSIAEKYDYKFPYSGEMSKDYYMDKISKNFPIYNDVHEFIVDELPMTNSEWTFENKSKGPDIILEVLPIDLRGRYPTDPDNNTHAFTYKIPGYLLSSLNKSATEEEIKTHTENVAAFFHGTVEKELVAIEAAIKEKVEFINTKLNGIDFSDPAVINEIQKKMKLR